MISPLHNLKLRRSKNTLPGCIFDIKEKIAEVIWNNHRCLGELLNEIHRLKLISICFSSMNQEKKCISVKLFNQVLCVIPWMWNVLQVESVNVEKGLSCTGIRIHTNDDYRDHWYKDAYSLLKSQWLAIWRFPVTHLLKSCLCTSGLACGDLQNKYVTVLELHCPKLSCAMILSDNACLRKDLRFSTSHLCIEWRNSVLYLIKVCHRKSIAKSNEIMAKETAKIN